MAGNEFGLDVFSFVCMLLTPPERLSTGNTLMIDCSGDEYSVLGDCSFDRVPITISPALSSASSKRIGRTTCGARRPASSTKLFSPGPALGLNAACRV